MSSIVEREIEHFSKDSPRWWDENGPFAPLHRLNPVRLSYIKAQICTHYGLDGRALRPFGDLGILDIGCGGGIVCEPLARLGAEVTGADADANAITAAKAHAAQGGLDIRYLDSPAEDIKGRFDVVLALEIIEHVEDPAAFVQSVSKLVKPGGLAIFSTLNRTVKSYALGILAAEHLLRWVPRGTHTWGKFVTPAELSHYARQSGLAPQDVSGLIFNPLKNEFALHKKDLDVNYLLCAQKG
jgi:2-polyprenyl-6-hydroxyphenyl methylase / 3-demethylubiquinone-9 3-methyltransferase